MIGTTRERPMKKCHVCGKEKPIVKHLNGDPSAPLCAACNMRLRRASATTDQVKAIKLATAVIGVMEQLLALDLDAAQEQEITAMQARIKILARVWLGDKDAGIIGDPSAAKRSVDPRADHDGHPTSPAWSELTQPEHDERIDAGRRAYFAKRRAQRETQQ